MDLVLPSITEGYMYSTIMDEMKGGGLFEPAEESKTIVGGMPIVEILNMRNDSSITGGSVEGLKALSDYAVPIGLVSIDYKYVNTLSMPQTCQRDYSVISDDKYDDLIGLVSNKNKSKSKKHLAKSSGSKKTLKRIIPKK